MAMSYGCAGAPVFTLKKMTYARTEADSSPEESEKEMVKQLDTLREHFVEHVWWATALFCAVLLVSVPLRVYHLASEWNWVNLFFVIVPLATLIAFRFRHRYSPAVRTLLPLALQLLVLNCVD